MQPSFKAGRRVILQEFGESPMEAVEQHLSLVPMEPLDTASFGPKDVLVEVRSATVGWVDLLMSSGQYQHMVRPPYTPGLESAGVVAWVGSEVRNIEVGAPVIVDGFLAGPRSLGGYQHWGGFASYMLAPEDAIIPIPGALSMDQAAGLLGAYETAYHCLVTRGRLQASDTLLLHGASGATGLAALQVAKIVGAKVIATSRSQSKLDQLVSLGADAGIKVTDDSGAIRSFRDDVKALTDGAGVSVVYDAVGGDISLESLRCVQFGARFLIVGWASTPFVARGKGLRGAPNANQLPTNLIMMKSLDVLGCPTILSTVQNPASRAPRLQQVLSWAKEGKIQPHVSHVFPMESFREAMRARWNGDVLGGCVLHPWE